MENNDELEKQNNEIKSNNKNNSHVRIVCMRAQQNLVVSRHIYK